MMEECKILFATLDTKSTYDQYFWAIRKMPIPPGGTPKAGPAPPGNSALTSLGETFFHLAVMYPRSFQDALLDSQLSRDRNTFLVKKTACRPVSLTWQNQVLLSINDDLVHLPLSGDGRLKEGVCRVFQISATLNLTRRYVP
jgi:hypothetical protein